MRLYGPHRPVRGRSIGKAVYVRELRGQLIACKWPRRRPRVKHPTTLAQMEKFRQANWATKYMPAKIQNGYRRLVEGTQLLPRDLLIASMYGRGFTTAIPGMTRRYPVAAVRDLSLTLDLLGSQPGDMLTRAPEGWRTSHPTQAGQVPVSQPAGQAPQWQTLAGGTGVWQQIEDVTLTLALALGAYRQVNIPSGWNQVDWAVIIAGTPAGTKLAARINADGNNRYAWQQQGLNTAGAGINAFGTAQPQWSMLHASVSPTTSVTFCSGRIVRRAATADVHMQADVEFNGHGLLKIVGYYTNVPAADITQLGFASIQGEGLPAGTRIIVRAARP